MINLRYHIISLTAVFLALGIGLTLGSTFLDRVTVDTLKEQLDTVQAAVDASEAESAELRERLSAFQAREEELAAELPERLVAGRLDEVPVLVVTTDGTAEALVEQTVSVVTGAGAEIVGSWGLTSRWTLDDDEEVRDLSDVLELSTDDEARLRRSAAIRLADALMAAVEPDADAEPAGPGDGAAGPTDPAGAPPEPGQDDPGPQAPVEPAAPEEPEIGALLEAAGFLDYGALPSDRERVRLPAEGLRVLVVSATTPGAGSQEMALALIDELTADEPFPVVAAQGAVALEDDDGDLRPDSERRTSFVGPLRDGELTRDRVSTVDVLDSAAGLAATVLALEDAGSLRLGHYGVAPGAARLLPGTAPET